MFEFCTRSLTTLVVTIYYKSLLDHNTTKTPGTKVL